MFTQSVRYLPVTYYTIVWSDPSETSTYTIYTYLYVYFFSAKKKNKSVRKWPHSIIDVVLFIKVYGTIYDTFPKKNDGKPDE